MKSRAWKILVADDEEGIRTFLGDFLKEHHYAPVLARDGREAITLVEKERPDLILLDVDMPGRSGIDVCKFVKSTPHLRLTPVVMITGHNDIKSRVAGLAAGADDFFSKPFDQQELSARVKSLLVLKHYINEMEHAESVITSLALCVEAKDAYTAGHCERLAMYGEKLARKIGLTESEIHAVRLGGILHDLGKIAVPDAILLKPGPLTPEERKTIETHPMRGTQLCEPLKTFEKIIPVIKHHHEKWNGTGYPDRLKGEAIPVTARIMAIVDVYDALRSKRSYKSALPLKETLKILEEETAKGYWDPHLVKEFVSLTHKAKGLPS